MSDGSSTRRPQVSKERWLGENAINFWNGHRAFSLVTIGFLIAYGLYAFVNNRTLHTPVAPGGHASLLQASTPERARAVLYSWTRVPTAKAGAVPEVACEKPRAVARPQQMPAQLPSRWLLVLCSLLDLAAGVSFGLMMGIAIRRAASDAPDGVLDDDAVETFIQRSLHRLAAVLIIALSIFQTLAFWLLWRNPVDPPLFWVRVGYWAFWLRLGVAGACLAYLFYRLHQRSFYLDKIFDSVSELGRVVNWTAFSFFLVALVCLVLLPFNQVQEALRVTFDPGSPGSSRFWLFVGTFLFSCSAWYLSRALIVTVIEDKATMRRLRRHSEMSPSHLEYWGALLPRLYAVAPFFCLWINIRRAAGGISRGEHGSSPEVERHVATLSAYGWSAFICIFLMILVVWLSAIQLGSIRDDITAAQQKPGAQGAFIRWTRWVARAVAAVYIGFVFFGYFKGFDWTAGVGALGALLCGLAGLNALGTGLNWLRIRFGYPVLSVLLLVAGLLAWYGINDNHTVRTLSSRAGEAIAPAAPWAKRRLQAQQPPLPVIGPREKLDAFEETFRRWLESRPDRPRDRQIPYPVVLVAAEGGGIRAACEAALTLAYLEDRLPGFRHHLFAASGVSGGSVGLATFAALCRRAQTDREADAQRPRVFEARKSWWVGKTQTLLGTDMLAPAVAALACGDVLQWFWPFPVQQFDRAAAIEKAFESAWLKAFPDCSEGNLLCAPFYRYGEEFIPGPETARGRTSTGIPALFFNTVRVETGDRMVLSTIPVPEVVGAEREQRLTSLDQVSPFVSLSLSTAAFLSARFTYISPSGGLPIYTEDGGAGSVAGGSTPPASSNLTQIGTIRYVDGGYFENSGAATALDIARALRRYRPRYLLHGGIPFRVVALRIGYPYDERAVDSPPGPSFPLDEVGSPLLALYFTRDGRARVAVSQLRAEVRSMHREDIDRGAATESSPSPYVDVRFDQCRQRPRLPFGWLISPGAQNELLRQLEDVSHPLENVRPQLDRCSPRHDLSYGKQAGVSAAVPVVATADGGRVEGVRRSVVPRRLARHRSESSTSTVNADGRFLNRQ